MTGRAPLKAAEMFDLAGRVAIVTGASSGLGHRFTQVLHEAGASVVAVARREDRLKALAASCERVLPVAADVTDGAALERLVATVIDRFGRVDILVNNAGHGLGSSWPIPNAPYAASKGGVIQLTRELACQWAKRGIRVNTLVPGFFPSESTELMQTDPKTAAYVERGTPMRRFGQEHELDGALVFLASDASSFTTGQMLVVDGGWTAH